MSEPAQQEIDELVRRLEAGRYPTSNIREAGELLAQACSKARAYQLALDYSTSQHEQVRMLGLCMMEALAPESDAARGFLAGSRDAAKLLRDTASKREAPPDYSAIGEVIKLWLRDSRNRRKRG